MKKRFLALALGTLAFGVTLGGVKMGLGHQDAMMVKAAADVARTALTFPDANKNLFIFTMGIVILLNKHKDVVDIDFLLFQKFNLKDDVILDIDYFSTLRSHLVF